MLKKALTAGILGLVACTGTLWVLGSAARSAVLAQSDEDIGRLFWRPVNNGLSNLNIRALAIDPVVSTTLYVETQQGAFKSTDAGANWVQTRSNDPYYTWGSEILTALIISVLAQPPAPNQAWSAAPQDDFTLTLVQHLGGSFFDVQVVDNYAYIAAGAGLYILDVSDPANPRRVGKFLGPQNATGLDVVGSNVFLAHRYGGLLILDVTDPTRPVQVGTYTPELGGAVNVDVAGNYAYVAAENGGLRIVDVSDLTQPHEVGRAQTGAGTWNVQVVGSYAFVVENDAGLLVLDVSDPTQPRQVGSFDVPNRSLGIQVEGNLAYVTYASIPGSGGGLAILDVADPTQPRQVAEYPTSEGVWGVYVSGNQAYLAVGEAGLLILGVSDPTQPVQQGSFDTPGFARSLVEAAGRLYVADDAGGLQILDVADPAQPQAVGAYATLAPEDVLVVGDSAYLAQGQMLYILQVADPAQPQVMGAYEPALPLPDGTRIQDLAASDGYVFLANGADGLRVVDVHDPAHPQEAGYLTFDGELLTVDVAGSYAYVGGTRGAWVVDVHNPAQPQVLTELPLSPPAGVYRIRTRGDVACVVGELVWTVDVADPSQPRQLGALPMALRSVRDADVENHWLYFVDWWDGLFVIDISDPTRLQQATTPGFVTRPEGVDAEGSQLYVAEGPSGLRVFDVREPAQPQEEARYRTPQWASGVHVSDKRIYLADQWGGLFILQATGLRQHLYLPLIVRQ